MSIKTQKIFLVEDNPADVELMKFVFAKYNQWDFIFHENGENFLKSLLSSDEKSVSLVVLDLGLPGKTGLEILNYLKGHPSYKSIPIVIFTASSDEFVRRQCFDLGIQDFVIKSADLDKYEASLDNIIRRWALQPATV